MGYKQIGTDKNGVKKFRITIELGKDLFGKRDRYYETFYGTVADVKIRDAELTKKYYHTRLVHLLYYIIIQWWTVEYWKQDICF